MRSSSSDSTAVMYSPLVFQGGRKGRIGMAGIVARSMAAGQESRLFHNFCPIGGTGYSAIFGAGAEPAG
jgi:hypothetical protein